MDALDHDARTREHRQLIKEKSMSTNTLLTVETISAATVALLANQATLINTVTKVNETWAGTGGTIQLRVRRPIAPSTFTGTVTTSDVTEHAVLVTPVHKYSAVNVDAAARTMSIVDFAEEILNPMVAGFVTDGDNAVAAALHAVTESGDFDITDADSIKASVLAMRRTLVQNRVPEGQRYIAASPDVIEALLGVPTFVDASKAGQSDTLTNGVLGSIFGCSVVEHPALESEAIAYGSSAFAYASLVTPDALGGAVSASADQDGLAIRVVYDFDFGSLSDVVAVDGWFGCAPVLDLVDTTPTQLRAVRYVLGS
jgi:hypothetical protein